MYYTRWLIDLLGGAINFCAQKSMPTGRIGIFLFLDSIPPLSGYQIGKPLQLVRFWIWSIQLGWFHVNWMDCPAWFKYLTVWSFQSIGLQNVLLCLLIMYPVTGTWCRTEQSGISLGWVLIGDTHASHEVAFLKIKNIVVLKSQICKWVSVT